MSIVPGLLMLNWLVEGELSRKFHRLKQRKSTLLVISVFFVYLAGLLWTNSMQWGLHDVKIQLPLLILPLVIGTSEDLSPLQLKQTIYVFSAAVITASFCSMWTLLGFSGKVIQDPREISLFISHIRFSLLINISIFAMTWYLVKTNKKNITERIVLTIAIIWLCIFLVILKSATGWIIFLIGWSAIIVISIIKIKKILWKVLLLSILTSMFLIPAAYISFVIKQFYNVEAIPSNISEIRTPKGNPYSNDFNNKQLENGHYTFLFLNEDELREAWKTKSKLNYDSSSAKGFNRYVLIRYLTSKGYRKDASSIEKLSPSDIQNIENGITNYRLASANSFYNRIYQVIWEFDVYQKGGNPSGHSVTQRIEYYKMAAHIIGEHFWFGTGTGGYYETYQQRYDQNKFFQNQKFRQRSHNMFLSYWIDFGLIGLIYICVALSLPVFLEHKTQNFLVLTFVLVVLISFMNEDTLNNHDAICFFAFLYPLFLYSKQEEDKLE